MPNRPRKWTDWLLRWDPSRALIHGLAASSAIPFAIRVVFPRAGVLLLALAAPCCGEESTAEEVTSAPYAELESPGIVADWLSERPRLASSDISVTGWLQQGFTWNPASPADRFNGYVTNNDRANEWQVNQAFVTIAHEVDPEAEEWDLGFHVDSLYGTDGVMFSSLGWDDRTVSDADSRFYKLAIPQLYADLHLPVAEGLRVQLGKWSTLVGYEYGFGAGFFLLAFTGLQSHALHPHRSTGDGVALRSIVRCQRNPSWQRRGRRQQQRPLVHRLFHLDQRGRIVDSLRRRQYGA